MIHDHGLPAVIHFGSINANGTKDRYSFLEDVRMLRDAVARC
jgi:hypothetical protein